MKSILTSEDANSEREGERKDSEVLVLGDWENGDAIHIKTLQES